MSMVAVSYKDLDDAAELADKVAKKVDDYADELSGIFKKISKYEGDWTDCMSGACDGVSMKIDNLRTKYSLFNDYSDDLEDLLEECKEVDERVKYKISRLTESFCKANGIRNPVIETYILGVFKDIIDNTAVGRFLSNTLDSVIFYGGQLIDAIKYTWTFSGWGMFTEHYFELWYDWVLATVNTALAVVAAIFKPDGPNILRCITTSQRLTFATADMVYYYINGVHATLGYYSGDLDASTRYRMLECDSFIDFLRKGFIWDENDDTRFNQATFIRDLAADYCDWQYIIGDTCDIVGSIMSWAGDGSVSAGVFHKTESIGNAIKAVGIGDTAHSLEGLIKDTFTSDGSLWDKAVAIFDWSAEHEPTGITGDHFDISRRINSIYANGHDSYMDLHKVLNKFINRNVGINVSPSYQGNWGTLPEELSYRIGPFPYFEFEPGHKYVIVYKPSSSVSITI